jgi:DNA-binding CsgD family transcriptional regulator
MSRDLWYLTPKQWQILDLTAQGDTEKEIAHKVGCSYQTVKNHRSHIYAMLEVTTSIQALRVAGYIQERDPLRQASVDLDRELRQLAHDIGEAEERVKVLRSRFEATRKAIHAETAA